ncbi:M23/M56 family metallopeptidase [Parahaliea mediterranea]|uniref:M23/M56 family metallopeptidase n=1 Tax=Parahaliea mediterranea TaxID=651086 RepID=UPI000E2E6033|nr:M23/M56 family metallopeptidase [Parahaliea mediterranea]
MEPQYLNYLCNLLIMLVSGQLLHTLILFALVFATCLLLQARHPRLQLALWGLVALRPFIPGDWQVGFTLRQLLDDLYPRLELLSANFHLTQLDLVNLLSRPLWPGYTQVSLAVSLVALWGLVSVCSVCHLLYRRRFYRRVVQRAALVTSGSAARLLAQVQLRCRVARRVRLLAGEGAESPFTMGTLRPVIFVPAPMLATLDEQALLTLLSHEMAHVKRCDDLWGVVIGLTRCVFFFFPLQRLVGRLWEEQREIVCDTLAVRCQCQTRGEYAQGLLDIVCYFRSRHTVSPGGVPGLSLRHDGYRARVLALGRQSLPGAREGAVMLLTLAFTMLFIMPTASGESAARALRERSQQLVPADIERLYLPVERGRVLAGFHDIPLDVPLGLGEMEVFHEGIDILLPEGSTVYALGPGRVERVVMEPLDGIAQSTGGYVSIRHDNGALVRYHYVGHSPLQQGQRLQGGEPIGRLLADHYSPRSFSAEGFPASPTRLHLAVFYQGVLVDPLQLLRFQGE